MSIAVLAAARHAHSQDSGATTGPATGPASAPAATRPAKPRTAVVILNGSLYMQGKRRDVMLAETARILSTLGPADRFNIAVARKGETKYIFGKPLEPATAERVRDANDYLLDRYRAVGSPDVSNALVGAYSVNASEVWLVSNAVIGDGAALVVKLKQLNRTKPNVRINVLNIEGGFTASKEETEQLMRLMERIAEVTGGEYRLVK